MNFQHKGLAEGGWSRLSFLEQMANIGSEVERSLNWRAKNKPGYSEPAFERALELVDVTLRTVKGYPRRKELCRLREALVDYFAGTNQFKSSEISWRRYFQSFTYVVRKNY